MGLWNVQSVNGKENEIIDEFEKADLSVLGITETKKKGNGCDIMKNGHYLIYGGVETTERARAGIGLLIRSNYYRHIRKWKICSERLLKIEFEMEHN